MVYVERPHRIRGSKLDAIRAAWRQAEPLCTHCKRAGRVRVWQELDHIVPLEFGGIDSADPFVNRQPLCKPCHRRKTAKDRGYVPVGGDANGMPTDPRHHWNDDDVSRETPHEEDDGTKKGH